MLTAAGCVCDVSDLHRYYLINVDHVTACDLEPSFKGVATVKNILRFPVCWNHILSNTCSIRYCISERFANS